MSIYPTLLDLCGLPIPAHVEGRSIRALLADPTSPWDLPAVTTYRMNNHTVRSEEWRYTRYFDGGEELYHHPTDPYEWTNLARQPGGAEAVKARLRQFLPTTNRLPVPWGGPN